MTPQVHPELAAILARRAALNLPAYSDGAPAEARAAFAASQAALPPDRGPAIHAIADGAVAGPAGPLRVRRYHPASGPARGRIVYFHGGGWVFGTLEAFDPVCRLLAHASGLEVVSVDYRLAPEAPFPAPLDDAYAALSAVAAEAPALPLAVMGDSAGGNLAAACALRARDARGPRIDLQVLVYPITDHDFARPSYEAFGGGGLVVSRADMEWYWAHYAPDPASRRHPYASPLRASDLSRLPPALLAVAGCDPLRDEGVAYAKALRAAGVAADLWEYPGLTHGFFTMTGLISPADAVGREVGEAIGRRLSAQSAASA